MAATMYIVALAPIFLYNLYYQQGVDYYGTSHQIECSDLFGIYENLSIRHFGLTENMFLLLSNVTALHIVQRTGNQHGKVRH